VVLPPSQYFGQPGLVVVFADWLGFKLLGESLAHVLHANGLSVGPRSLSHACVKIGLDPPAFDLAALDLAALLQKRLVALGHG
jgi:hypothetical protein